MLQRPMVLPSLEKRLPPPPRRSVPAAYELRTQILPISPGIRIEIVPRDSSRLDIFFLNEKDARIQIPANLELVKSSDMRPVRTCCIQPDMPYSMWSGILKSERYALVDLDSGKVLYQLKFRWDVRVITS